MTWLESIMKEHNIKIQTVLSPEGEYFIPGIGKVDGYHRETNTVFEYHGDFWHGNSLVFDADDINPVTGKTFGQLYSDTWHRDYTIRQLGYKLVILNSKL
jgi:hypothetical protein